MGTIAVKNVDDKLYRRAKALASLRGRTIGEAINEALAMWLSGKTTVDLLDKWDDLERQSEANDKAFASLRGDLLVKHRGEYALIASGKLQGVYRNREDAFRRALQSGSKQATVAHLVEEEPRVIEFGWSLTTVRKDAHPLQGWEGLL